MFKNQIYVPTMNHKLPYIFLFLNLFLIKLYNSKHERFTSHYNNTHRAHENHHKRLTLLNTINKSYDNYMYYDETFRYCLKKC